MKILSVNAGSSSLKFRLYEMPEENLLISGVFERIGIEGSFYTIKYNGEKIKKEVELKNHKDAFNYLVSELLENKVVTSLEEIKGIGHRAVQGGASYNKAVFADEEVINNLREEYNNKDIKGVLEIDNTDYIVPILQGSDNNYYLNHDAYGNRSGMGSIYLDFRVDIDTSRKLLIYGHNSSNIDMPFKILEEFYDKDYYDNHKYVWITTSTAKKKYEIFSIYVETKDFSYMDVNFASDKDYLEHITKLKEKSMYDTGVEVNSDDEVLILQTCSTHKDYSNYQRKYLLIILRRV